MNINKIKIAACCAAFIIAAQSAPFGVVSPVKAELTVKELEQQKAENNLKISELQKEIEKAKAEYENIVSDENAKIEYQDILSEKIILQNQNISMVVEQINQIDADIQDNLADINNTEDQIKNQNMMIDANLELYKQRLRASYMSDGDNISAVLAGSTSFLDLLSKLEIVTKVAEHDNNLINDLNDQLQTLKKLNDELSHKQEELSVNLEDATTRKNELNEKLDELNSDYDYTQSEIERLQSEKEETQHSIEETNEIIEEKKKEQEKVDAAIAGVLEKIRQESIAESKRVSESVAQSIAESQRIESEKAEQNKPVTQPPVQQQQPVTQPPQENNTPPVTVAPEPEPAPEVQDSSLMYWPVPGFTRLSSDFWDGRNHGAIDVQGHPGTNGYVEINGAKVYACDDGIVAAAVSTCTHQWCRCGGGYGNYVAIQHSDAVYSTYYAHLQSVFVSAGQYVKKGQLIGLVGNTGQSSGPHLHFEVRKNGVKTDPMSYNYQNQY